MKKIREINYLFFSYIQYFNIAARIVRKEHKQELEPNAAKGGKIKKARWTVYLSFSTTYQDLEPCYLWKANKEFQ